MEGLRVILKWHIPYYREIFALPGFLQAPILSFGSQGIEGATSGTPQPATPLIPRVRRFLTSEKKVKKLLGFARSQFPQQPLPADFRFNSLTELLRSKGYPVTTLDYFDGAADLRYDMNQAVPEFEHGRYGTFIDIGCLEHLFDTAACLENCLRMTRPGGYYLLHTPINGYFGHGLHVFNPQGLADCLRCNGFRIVYFKYSTYKGKSIPDPSKHRNAIVWLVGRKEKEISTFVCPQQMIWATDYYPQSVESANVA